MTQFSGNDVTVLRGDDGTAAATHASGATVILSGCAATPRSSKGSPSEERRREPGNGPWHYRASEGLASRPGHRRLSRRRHPYVRRTYLSRMRITGTFQRADQRMWRRRSLDLAGTDNGFGYANLLVCQVIPVGRSATTMCSRGERDISCVAEGANGGFNNRNPDGHASSKCVFIDCDDETGGGSILDLQALAINCNFNKGWVGDGIIFGASPTGGLTFQLGAVGPVVLQPVPGFPERPPGRRKTRVQREHPLRAGAQHL